MAVPGGRLRFGPDSGRLLLRTRRSGFASRVGHDLTIEVTVWSAEVDVSDGLPKTQTGKIQRFLLRSKG